MRKPRNIVAYGREGLLLIWEQTITPGIGRSVQSYRSAINAWPEVRECVPSYASLLVTFDESITSQEEMRERLYQVSPTAPPPEKSRTVHRLPVWYGGEAGPDLATVADRLSLTTEGVIRLHCEPVYYVYQIGYQPGFAFLGNTHEQLQIDRRENPRNVVPAGSVAIAGRQTAVYPTAAPGGWQILGRCPVPMTDAGAATARKAFLLWPGDRVQFVPITKAVFLKVQRDPTTWMPSD